MDKGNTCWPRDLQREDDPRARIRTWGYHSTAASLTGYTRNKGGFNRAGTLIINLGLRDDNVATGHLNLQATAPVTVPYSKDCAFSWSLIPKTRRKTSYCLNPKYAIVQEPDDHEKIYQDKLCSLEL